MRGEDEGARKLRVYALLEARYHFYVAFHASRRALEEPIRRRYYHVAPLPAAELAAWRRLLSWGAAQPTGHVCDPLEPMAEVLPSFTYERCLLPGASVRSLWKEYALFLEGKGAVEDARGVLARASGVFFRDCAPMLLYHAQFEEAHGGLDAARALCAATCALPPPAIDAYLAAANLERRAGNTDGMRAAFAAAVDALRGEPLAALVRHAAAVERKLCGDHARGVALIESAIAREPANELLWDAALECATSAVVPAAAGAGDSPAYQAAAALLERMIAADSPLPPPARRRAWLRYQRLVDDYAGSVDAMRALKRSRDEAGLELTLDSEVPESAVPKPLPKRKPNGMSVDVSMGGGAAQPSPSPQQAQAQYTPEQLAQYQQYYAQYYQQQGYGQGYYPQQ